MKKKIAALLACIIISAAAMTVCGKESVRISDFVSAGTITSIKNEAVPIPLGEKYYGKTEGGKNSKTWYCFTTGEKENCSYDITVVNKTDPASNRLFNAEIYDKKGNTLNKKSQGIKPNGLAHTNRVSLSAETTYYILINNLNSVVSSDSIEYMILIRDPSDPSHSNLLGTGGTADPESGAVKGGTSQDDSVLLPLDTRVYGTGRETGNAWYAFTTGEADDHTYNITVIQKTAKRRGLFIWIYDELGNCLNRGNSLVADNSYSLGVAHTDSLQLLPLTTYYIRIETNAVLDFVLRVKDPSAVTSGHRTTGSISEARGTSDVLEGTASAGTNQDEALMLPFGTEFSGKASNRIGSFVSFTTADQEGCTYRIRAVHDTSDASDFVFNMYDEYGSPVGKKHVSISGKGTAYEQELDLSTDTTYYIELWNNDDARYKLTVDVDGLLVPEEPEPLVFEEPFELNETMVHFVANQAVFVDEEAVKAALKPVAGIILDHPGHPILLAGTTATWGSQKTSVELSLKRAGAVKDFLVTHFGIPDEQLLTIGLGYEDDPFVRGEDIDKNGNFVETEGAKNRRVIVLDAEDPIAVKLLKK